MIFYCFGRFFWDGKNAPNLLSIAVLYGGGMTALPEPDFT